MTNLKHLLSDLPLGEIKYQARTGSTNDDALVWATEGARDLSLVVADEQTAGRGRLNRKWITPPNAALAFSLILRPTDAERTHISLLSGLAALALVDALAKLNVGAQIKWPNDVLIECRKVAGILVESVWTGDKLESAVIGMGVNVAAGALPPADQLNFPATSLEAEGARLDRFVLLHDILEALLGWRAQLAGPAFIRAWESKLAFRGETVQVWREPGEAVTGTLLGLESDGSLRLAAGGRIRTIQYGEVHLRPA
jgi:BirA family biotin operon repressor/biotin-[acetyl-CoA-carboxylase] ligase